MQHWYNVYPPDPHIDFAEHQPCTISDWLFQGHTLPGMLWRCGSQGKEFVVFSTLQCPVSSDALWSFTAYCAFHIHLAPFNIHANTPSCEDGLMFTQYVWVGVVNATESLGPLPDFDLPVPSTVSQKLEVKVVDEAFSTLTSRSLAERQQIGIKTKYLKTGRNERRNTRLPRRQECAHWRGEAMHKWPCLPNVILPLSRRKLPFLGLRKVLLLSQMKRRN